MTLQNLVAEVFGLGILLVVGLIGIALLKALVNVGRKEEGERGRYLLKKSLVSPAERSFLGCLDSVVAPGVRVLAKVRLADIFYVGAEIDRSAWGTAFNRIKSKHVDFLLCRADDLAPLVAIELDDKSHHRSDRKERDEFLERLFANSKITLFRVRVQNSYDAGKLAQQLSTAMQPFLEK